MPRARSLLAVLLSSNIFAACSEPPKQEMQQAQAAIDAAQAAQAAEYAPDELKAAVGALTEARTAAGNRDYRLALNHALESRERAQAAARDAADRRTAQHSDADRMIVAATEAIDRADTRLKGMDARSSRAAQLRTAVDHAKARLQEARTVMDAEAFANAETAARAALAALTPISTATEAATSQPAAPRRP